MDVSIIIVNFNTKQLTIDCIESIKNHTRDISYEVILVDNASTDGSSEYFSSMEKIKFVQSETNLGFGAGNNLGARVADGKFLFLLNSDTILRENSIKKIYDFYKSNSGKLNLGVVGCVLTNKEGLIANSGGGFPLVLSELKEYVYISLEKLLRKKFSPRDPYDFTLEFFEIDYIIGADMFLPRQLFVDMNGFDEDFFMYFEEADLQKRIRNTGLKNFITTSTKIVHLEGVSSGGQKKNIKKRWIYQKSRNLYFKKNDPNNYVLYIMADSLINVIRLFNTAYTFRENLSFIGKNLKSY